MKQRNLWAVCAAGVFLALAPGAKAGLIGDTLSWQYYSFGGVYSSASSSGSFLDTGSGVGGQFNIDSQNIYFNIDATDNSITFDYSVTTLGPDSWSSSVLSLSPTIFNGIAIDIAGGSFTGVTLDAATNMAGFTASNFSFTGSELQVDWQNLNFDNSTIVKLDIDGTSTGVPEPASFLLIGSGIAALAGLRLRRARS